MVFDGVTVAVLLIIFVSTLVRAVFGFGNALVALIHRQKEQKTSLILINQGDRVILVKNPIINEVKRLWHKVFWHSSTNRRKRIRG